jgi:hypothetical protein
LKYLLNKYPDFKKNTRGLARICGQIAFAYAATGDRRSSLAWIRRCLSLDPRQPRGYLAAAVVSGVVAPERIVRFLNRSGRGI